MRQVHRVARWTRWLSLAALVVFPLVVGARPGPVTVAQDAPLLETVCGFPVQPLESRIDTSFGNGGYVELSGELASPDGATPLISEGTGGSLTLYLGLERTAPTNQDLLIARLAPDGRQEQTFGTVGMARIPVPPHVHIEWINHLAVGPDGSVLVSGHSRASGSAAAGPSFATIMRITSAGVLDSTFGRAGLIWEESAEDTSLFGTSANEAAIWPDGSIAVLVTVRDRPNEHYRLQTYDRSGERIAVNDIEGMAARSLHTFPDFTAVLLTRSFGGSLSDGITTPAILQRFTREGALDVSFGQKGKVILNDSPAFAWYWATRAERAGQDVLAVTSIYYAGPIGLELTPIPAYSPNLMVSLLTAERNGDVARWAMHSPIILSFEPCAVGNLHLMEMESGGFDFIGELWVPVPDPLGSTKRFELRGVVLGSLTTSPTGEVVATTSAVITNTIPRPGNDAINLAGQSSGRPLLSLAVPSARQDRTHSRLLARLR